MNLHIDDEKKAFEMWMNHTPLSEYLLHFKHEIEGVYGLGFNMPMGFCYQNALLLAQQHPEKYTYFEGLAFHFIPMWHAWLYDHDMQKFVDPTWGEHPHFYMGAPFTLSDLEHNLEQTDIYGFYDNHHLMRLSRTNPGYLTEMMERGRDLFQHRVSATMSIPAL